MTFDSVDTLKFMGIAYSIHRSNSVLLPARFEMLYSLFFRDCVTHLCIDIEHVRIVNFRRPVAAC